MTRIVTKIAGGKIGIYIKPTSGDLTAPFTVPGANLDKVLFHSDLDYLRRHMGPTNVTINFPLVAGTTRTFTDSFPTFNIKGQYVRTDFDLITHNLGYIPTFWVINAGKIVTSGYDIQSVNDVDGIRTRQISAYATTTKIWLASFGASNASDLPALSGEVFTVVVFKRPTAINDVDYHFDTTTGLCQMGNGKFDSDQKMLRAALAGESPYDLPLGPTIHIKNGRARRVLADGVTRDENGYNGTFAGPASFQGVIS